jgi:hypothetical protein
MPHPVAMLPGSTSRLQAVDVSSHLSNGLRDEGHISNGPLTHWVVVANGRNYPIDVECRAEFNPPSYVQFFDTSFPSGFSHTWIERRTVKAWQAPKPTKRKFFGGYSVEPVGGFGNFTEFPLEVVVTVRDRLRKKRSSNPAVICARP